MLVAELEGMTGTSPLRMIGAVCSAVVIIFANRTLSLADDAQTTRGQIQMLRQQNDKLQQQLQNQQQLIDALSNKVAAIPETCPFDLGLYKNPTVKTVTFDKPGPVDVFCSIHSSMNCVVLVLENPYFAVTNEKSDYIIPNIPAGTYKMKAWHERLPPQIHEVTVPESGDVKMDFTFGITGLPKI